VDAPKLRELQRKNGAGEFRRHCASRKRLTQSIKPPTGPAAQEPRPENTISRVNPWTLGCSLIDSEPQVKQEGHKSEQRINNVFHDSRFSSAATPIEHSMLTTFPKMITNIKV
jgi:hypothetical protein